MSARFWILDSELTLNGDFLDDCRRSGALSDEDYEVLLKVKLEGFEGKELAPLDGSPSAMAIHQRIHRIMDRLRRTASQ